ncbi:MAG TPA: LysR family transcriptional regulator [Xanthobacteraceae bacterium]|nr:LysR family transcriptional regulator [Xanthobacteraceae bacterium]
MLNEIDLSRADLNLLTLFEVVLTERHVARAAQKLNLSPSAISHGLGRLRRLLNDPLFLRTPRGVVPTARALELAEPIADVLARARRVIATAEPFDPATSRRRFTLGAPDGVTAAFLPPLLDELRRTAPGIDLSVRQLLPPQELRQISQRSWESALAELDAREIDIAVLPADDVPARFAGRRLYEERFTIAMRAGHPFADDPSLDRFCEMRHLVVSLRGDPYGFVDDALAQKGRTRRVALTAPSFAYAISLVAQTDLLAALPRLFATLFEKRLGIVMVDPPIALPQFPIWAVTPKAALTDAGVAWLFELVAKHATRSAPKERRRT